LSGNTRPARQRPTRADRLPAAQTRARRPGGLRIPAPAHEAGQGRPGTPTGEAADAERVHHQPGSQGVGEDPRGDGARPARPLMNEGEAAASIRPGSTGRQRTRRPQREVPMTLRTALLLLIVGSGLASASAPQAPLPSDEACRPLPPLLDLPPFPEGERLKFELDAMGAKAGQMTMQVLPLEDGLMPIRVEAEASTFLRSLRNVKGQATTWVDPRRLTPRRYAETSQDNDVQRRYRVTFSKDAAAVGWSFNGRRGQSVLALPKTTYDVAGITYLARRLPLKEGQSLCLDLYGV